MSRIVADLLLKSPITGDKIPLKQYDYQSLAAPRSFDLSGEDVASVKVIELGYTTANHRSLLVKIWAKDVDDIYTAARSHAMSHRGERCSTRSSDSWHSNPFSAQFRLRAVKAGHGRTSPVPGAVAMGRTGLTCCAITVPGRREEASGP